VQVADRFHLLRSLASDVSYERKDGRNHLLVRI